MIILQTRLSHNCLPRTPEHIHIFEYNLYIGDVKVSSEGRCLELLQQTFVPLPFSSKPQQPKKILARKTASIQCPV